MWLAESIPEPLARGTGIRHAASDVLVDLDVGGAVTAGQLVATIDSILTELPDTTVRLPPHVPARVFDHTAGDPRVVGELDRRQRERASLSITQRVPGVWGPGRLATLAERWRDVSSGVLVVGDPRCPAATVTPSRAAGRRRRARALALPDDQLERLVQTVQLGAADVGLRPLTAEIDLAAHFGRW